MSASGATTPGVADTPGVPGDARRPALVPARFLARPNRFIVEAALSSGRRVRAHLADPGRLKELLLPGAELRLRPASPSAARRTAFSVELVRATSSPRAWVGLVTTRANRLAHGLLARGVVCGVGSGWHIR
ncbi:MAG: hypothetical protein ACE5IK_14990, partial [Acidobacteriota bacterium]